MIEALLGIIGILAASLVTALVALVRLRLWPDTTNKLVENELKHIREDIAALSIRIDQNLHQMDERIIYLERR